MTVTLSRRGLVGMLGVTVVAPSIPRIGLGHVTLPRVAVIDLGIPSTAGIRAVLGRGTVSMTHEPTGFMWSGGLRSGSDTDGTLNAMLDRVADMQTRGWTLDTCVTPLRVPLSAPRAFTGLFRGLDRLLASLGPDCGNVRADAIERSLMARGGSWLSCQSPLGHEREHEVSVHTALPSPPMTEDEADDVR